MFQYKDLVSYSKVVGEKIRFMLILYFMAIVVFSLFGLVLQAKLFFLQQKLMIDKNPKLRFELKKVLDLMLVTHSQLFRACGPVGVAYYLIMIAGTIAYCLPNVIPELKLFDYLSENRSLAYLVEPEVESERASSRIDKYIQDVMESNVNVTAIALSKLNEGDLYNCSRTVRSFGRRFDELDGKNDDNYFQSIRSQCIEIREQGGSLRTPKRVIVRETVQPRLAGSLIIKDRDENQHSIAKMLFLVNLRDQMQCLIRLGCRKEKIWPSGRNSNWAVQTKRMWKATYVAVFVIFWTFAQMVTFVGVSISLSSIESYSFDAEYRTITSMDRLSGSNVHIISYFCALFAATPLLVLFVNISEIFRQFSSVESKVNQFSYKLRKLDCSRNRSLFKYRKFREFHHMKRHLYFECDTSALELYISYMIFRGEMRANLKPAQLAATQNVTFILIVLVPMLAFIKYILLGETFIVATCMIVVLFSIDFGLLLCGAVHAHCFKYSRRIWALIAYAERYNLETFNMLHTFPSDFDIEYQNNADFDMKKVIPNNFDYEYHLHGLLTFHTLSLWRRLAMHEELVPDHFICKLFGKFKVNYHAILRYNYWIISSVLVILNASYT